MSDGATEYIDTVNAGFKTGVEAAVKVFAERLVFDTLEAMMLNSRLDWVARRDRSIAAMRRFREVVDELGALLDDAGLLGASTKRSDDD